MKILIGTGALSWNATERRSDRYGSVGLFNENSEDQTITSGAHLKLEVIKPLIGKKFKLMCEVLETRESTHIGDLFHGFMPSTPKKGEEIELGEGYLFQEEKDNFQYVGLDPKRDGFWLKPKKLYRAHEQTVNLYLIPSE